MAITSNQGSSYLLYAIAAPIIGGVSVLVGTVTSRGAGRCTAADGDQVGLAIVNVPSFYVGMIGGVIILSLSPLMLSGSVTSDSPAPR